MVDITSVTQAEQKRTRDSADDSDRNVCDPGFSRRIQVSDSIDAASDIGCDLSGFSVPRMAACRDAAPDVLRPGPVEFIPDRNATDKRLYGSWYQRASQQDAHEPDLIAGLEGANRHLSMLLSSARQTIEDLQRRLAAADDAPARERIGPDDAAHRNVRDTIDHLLGGKVTKPAREALGKALEKADAPPTGRAASDAGIGRAIRQCYTSLTHSRSDNNGGES